MFCTIYRQGIFSYYHFKHPSFMICTQICFSLVFSLGFRATGVISFPIEKRHLGGCVVLATVWSINVVSGIAALQYLSVPMWSTLRRLVRFPGTFRGGSTWFSGDFPLLSRSFRGHCG